MDLSAGSIKVVGGWEETRLWPLHPHALPCPFQSQIELIDKAVLLPKQMTVATRRLP